MKKNMRLKITDRYIYCVHFLLFKKLLTEDFGTAHRRNYMTKTWFQDNKHPTVTQMLQYCGKTTQYFNAKESAPSVHLFIAKAFDTKDHKAIYNRLEKIGFDRNFFQFKEKIKVMSKFLAHDIEIPLKSYLTNFGIIFTIILNWSDHTSQRISKRPLATYILEKKCSLYRQN